MKLSQLMPIAAEMNRQLAGGVVQKVYAPTTTRLYLELRVPGRSVLLLVCSEAGSPRISAVTDRPPNPPTPPTWQSVLRRELTGAKLADAEALPERKTLLLHFTKAQKYLTLVLEATTAPALILCVGDKVLSQSVPTRPGLRVGHPWVPLPAGEVKEGKPESPELTSPGVRPFLPLLHSIEEGNAPVEQKKWADARRAPVLAKLKKLKRTIEKVRAEADRSTQTAALKREGELLAQNLYRLKRGEKTVALTEYLEDGSTREVTLALDPARTPQQEVEHRFRQYKRLSRGAEIAGKRLLKLRREAEALEQALQTPDATPAEAPAFSAKKKPAQPEALPYREYTGHGGQRIWVGRGSTHNDELTFHVARPHHVWFHARGVPGAHVVVPLDKHAQLTPQVLLDAAHLAAHHSDARGEPRVEVSYVPAKYVHKPKDAAPGAVVYTREKTLLLKLESQRLERLLATV